MTLAAGEQREDVVVYLRRGAELTVRVHPAAGPIAGRSVQLTGGGWRREETDADGQVVFTGLDPLTRTRIRQFVNRHVVARAG